MDCRGAGAQGRRGDGDALHAGKRRLKIMAWAASARLKQKVPQESHTRELAGAGLGLHARRLYEAKERDGCVSCLRLCLRFCFEQQNGGPEEDVMTDAREESRSRLVRLLSPFREEPAKWELAARRLCQVGGPESAQFQSTNSDTTELHHLLGLAYLTCGRESSSKDVREAFYRASECYLRDGIALGASDNEAPYSAQAELHRDLALLYTDMYLLSQQQPISLLTAGACHLSKAADNFAAVARYDR